MSSKTVSTSEERLEEILNQIPEDHALYNVLVSMKRRTTDRTEEAAYKAVAELAESWTNDIEGRKNNQVSSDIADVITQLKNVQVEYYRELQKTISNHESSEQS